MLKTSVWRTVSGDSIYYYCAHDRFPEVTWGYWLRLGEATHCLCAQCFTSSFVANYFDWFYFIHGSVQSVLGLFMLWRGTETLIRPDASSVPAVHGVWEEWSPWSLCSFTCGRGHRTRTRMCAPPQHGGRACDGPETQTKLCNIALCPGIIYLSLSTHI